MSKTQGRSAEMATDDLDWEIVTAVADAKGVEPLELEERLYDVVDIDAIRDLFTGASDGATAIHGQVRFTLAQCEVRVDDRCEVSVVPPSNVAAD